jgi:sugar/nucleoside kinase (ribokinase family)
VDRASSSASSQSDSRDLCVVGNLLIDLIIKGVPALPKWGQEAIGTGRSDDVGGQGANLARAAAQLGLSTAVASVVGNDASGQRIRDTLQSDGIDTTMVDQVPGDTALAVAAVRPDGERAYLTPAWLARHAPVIRHARAVALVGTSNLPGLDQASAARLLAEVRAAGALSVFDPGWSAEEVPATAQDIAEVLRVTDLFLPNRDEAQALTGTTDLASMLNALSGFCAGTVIVKCGSEGSAVLLNGQVTVTEALPVSVESAVGAGDVFDAGVISGLLETGDPVTAMVRGTAVASLYISRGSSRFATIPAWRDAAHQVRVRQN